MTRPPTPANEPLITRSLLMRMAVMVLTAVACVMGYFLWRQGTGASIEQVRSETFTLLVVCQWFNVLNCRSATSSALNLSLFKNVWLLGGLLLGNALHFLVIYWPPMNPIFHTAPIPLLNFLLIGAVGSAVLWVEEARKWWVRRNYACSFTQRVA
jgi:Ca2+-transporting ATPase